MSRPRPRLGPRRGRRIAPSIGPFFALTCVLAACAPGPTQAPSVVPTATPLPTPVTTTYAIETTAWYAGLLIHFDAATSVIDEGGGVVTIDLRLENPGSELATLNVGVLLAAGGRAVEPTRGTVIPDVAPGASTGLTLQFDVDGSFDVARAALRIGRPAEHIVIVPLVAGSAALTTLEPRALELKGTATAGSLAVTLAGGEVRADLPDWGLELPRGTMALSLVYSARYRGDFAGGFAFTGANIRLRLPDGTVIPARPDGHSQSVAVLEPGAAVPNLSSRFDVPEPVAGSYALEVIDGSRHAFLAFTIDEPAPGG